VIVLDVNILIAAHRSDHPRHAVAHRWLADRLAEGAELVISDLVWVGLARIATNSRVFVLPSSIDDVAEFAEAILSAEGIRPHGRPLRGIRALFDECRAGEAVGDLVPDAYIAAVARNLNCPVASFDRDFRRFDGIQLIIPQ
jgi:toxin-antitoxin system PIN domain toxin